MFADTDAGSIITAAQSGARWGYRLLWLQVVLIPVLFIVQELTARLGVYTGKGHGELIRDTFGRSWAWLSVAGLTIASFGALLTEFSGIVGVGQLFGISTIASLSLAVIILLATVLTGSYVRVERIALALGAFELAFVAIACYSRPDAHTLWLQMRQVPFGDSGYLYLVAANIGAVIMPWMVFYQQSAVTDKGLTPREYRAARWDTAIGAVVTQLIMAAILVATAAVFAREHTHTDLETVGQISRALTPVLGIGFGRVVFALGVAGAAMVAAIVVSLATAWGVGEVGGHHHSLSQAPRQAPWFYIVYAVAVVAGAVTVGIVHNLVMLSIAIEVMNALLLPLVLGFLVLLAFKALPHAVRLRGAYAWIVVGTVALTSLLGVVGAVTGIVGILR